MSELAPVILKYGMGDREFTSTLYYGADVRDSLQRLPAGSVQCVVTSPPYWGLRSYLPDESDLKDSEVGMEQTPEAYVESMVEVFREVHRVLRDDGVLWLNIGDSYSRGDRGTVPTQRGALSSKSDSERYLFSSAAAKMGSHPTIKPKDLVGIPWQVALALRADGWYLRSDTIWSKGSCMPESVTDRPTRSHEYVFLLAKSENYFYDHVAVLEDSVTEAGKTRNRRSVWTIATEGRPVARLRPDLTPEQRAYVVGKLTTLRLL